MNNINSIDITEFKQIQRIITLHRSKPFQVVNNENLLTSWEIGVFLSERIRNSAWDSKTVKQQLNEFVQPKTEQIEKMEITQQMTEQIVHAAHVQLQNVEIIKPIVQH